MDTHAYLDHRCLHMAKVFNDILANDALNNWVLFVIHRNLFTLSLCVIGRLYSVIVARLGHLLYSCQAIER